MSVRKLGSSLIVTAHGYAASCRAPAQSPPTPARQYYYPNIAFKRVSSRKKERFLGSGLIAPIWLLISLVFYFRFSVFLALMPPTKIKIPWRRRGAVGVCAAFPVYFRSPSVAADVHVCDAVGEITGIYVNIAVCAPSSIRVHNVLSNSVCVQIVHYYDLSASARVCVLCKGARGISCRAEIVVCACAGDIYIISIRVICVIVTVLVEIVCVVAGP